MMEVKPQPNLSFHGLDIYDVVFRSLKPYEKGVLMNLKVTPKVFYPEDSTTDFKIIFDTSVDCTDYFNLSVAAVGHFSVKEDIPEAIKKALINTNAPAIMFPYIRSFISTLTGNIGSATGLVMLPPHFFKGDLEEVHIEDYKQKPE